MTATLSASSLVQAVLALLGPTQNQRLLRLHTPLGPNVLLAERMLGSETLGPWAPGGVAGFKFELLALSTNAHLSLKDLIGQPVRLDLLTQQSATVLRPFHGHVTAFALLGSDGGLARYKLTIEPW
ncbi:MAG: type secretion system secreted protein VgrG, partial [Pseudomonadota bacterium]